MSRLLFALMSLALALPVHAEVVTEKIAYEHDGTQLEGFFAYDNDIEEAPGVLVVHAWWGLGEHAKNRAVQLAEMGYAAFALDMYQAGFLTEQPERAAAWAKPFVEDRQKMRDRAQAGLDILMQQEQVDTDRLAAIGFCFGGSTVVELAYSGAPLAAIVSFHGNPKPIADDDLDRDEYASLLVIQGSEDPYFGPTPMRKFMTAADHADLDWQVIWIGGAVHSFMSPEADDRGMDSVAYSQVAADRSWGYMEAFFDEVFDFNVDE